MNYRFLGIAWAVCVLGAIGCGVPDAVPGGTPLSDDAPLSDEEILSVPAPTPDEYVKVYEELLNQDPNLDPESHSFARLVLRKIKETTAQSSPDAVVMQGTSVLSLTKAEWLLVNRYPRKAVASFAAAKLAEVRAGAFDYGYGLAGGKSDAFRHAYWNVLMAKCCGLDWARDFATAHESESYSKLDDVKMDLNNNEVGRNIFSSAPEAWDAEHVQMIKDFSTSCMSSGVTHDPTRLVYMLPCPSVAIQQSYDGIVEVVVDGTSLGVVPEFGSRGFGTKDLRTGTHALTLTCTKGGTFGPGCQFAVTLSIGMLTFEDGSFVKLLVLGEGVSMTLPIIVPNFGTTPWPPRG
jgi:hypothetical protein